MEYADDKINGDGIEPTGDADQGRSDGARSFNDRPNGPRVGEYIAVAVKSVAVALSLMILITCILAVCFPLGAMRVYNSLGMSARAVDFAERYISRELNKYDADKTDEIGNYVKLSQTEQLSDDDFIEAIYVTVNLTYKLMEDSFADGENAEGRYYAERLEKYTRMYMSLYGSAKILEQTDADNMASMPLQLKPAVYSYGQKMRALNFRARARLGETDKLLYNGRDPSKTVTTLYERSSTLGGVSPNADIIDDYCDYMGALGEYLDVEFLRAGVENDVSKKGTVNGVTMDILSDSYIIANYAGKLTGDEFGLFLQKRADNAFTATYLNLKQFTVYAQYAADYAPSGSEESYRNGQLRQLFWLQTLGTASRRLWYMEKLIYQNIDKFGAAGDAIRDNYGVCQDYTFVNYEGVKRSISEVYRIKLSSYLSSYPS